VRTLAILADCGSAEVAGVLLENVHGWYSKEEDGFRLIMQADRDINVKRVSVRTVLARASTCHYGVPQLRRAFFLVASVAGRSFRSPTDAHSSEKAEILTLGEMGTAVYSRMGLNRRHSSAGPARPQGGGMWARSLPSNPEEKTISG
jgi:site-specific DNA-cytosine methylase